MHVYTAMQVKKWGTMSKMEYMFRVCTQVCSHPFNQHSLQKKISSNWSTTRKLSRQIEECLTSFTFLVVSFYSFVKILNMQTEKAYKMKIAMSANGHSSVQCQVSDRILERKRESGNEITGVCKDGVDE